MLVHARTHGRTDGGCLASPAPRATRRVARFAILFTFSSATVAVLVRRSSDDDGDRNSSSSSNGSSSSSSGGSDAVIQYGSPHTCQNKRTERSARPGRAPNSNSPEGRSALSTAPSRVGAAASRNHCERRMIRMTIQNVRSGRERERNGTTKREKERQTHDAYAARARRRLPVDAPGGGRRTKGGGDSARPQWCSVGVQAFEAHPRSCLRHSRRHRACFLFCIFHVLLVAFMLL